MYEIVRLDLSTLDLKTLEAFDQLTLPELRPCLRGKDPYGISNVKIVAIGAFHQGKPIALALASLKLHLHIASVESLYVLPEYRNQNIGTRLLALLQDHLKKEKAYLLTFNYPTGQEGSLAIEKVLLVNEWKERRPFMKRIVLSWETFPRNWLKRAITYPPSFQQFLWKEVTEKEKQEIRMMEAQGIFPATVSPFQEQDQIEYCNSLALKENGKVIGWMITHRFDAETIRYSSLFIENHYRQYGFALKLVADAVELHYQSHIPKGLVELPLLHISHSWLKFVQKHLIPHALSVTHIQQAWKTI